MSNHDLSQSARLLVAPRLERAAGSTGFIAHLSGRPTHALATISSLARRGAVAADACTADSAGILTQISYESVEHELTRASIAPPSRGELAIGVCFLPLHDLEATDLGRKRRSLPATFNDPKPRGANDNE